MRTWEHTAKQVITTCSPPGQILIGGYYCPAVTGFNSRASPRHPNSREALPPWYLDPSPTVRGLLLLELPGWYVNMMHRVRRHVGTSWLFCSNHQQWTLTWLLTNISVLLSCHVVTFCLPSLLHVISVFFHVLIDSFVILTHCLVQLQCKVSSLSPSASGC